ncbi:restriction endonuclease subunit S [Clostridium fessum]|uniref:restriction endonuclease subunit S n=1 Tax=Clostridium fessum TaxID=2126740 RepID=UPI00399977B3
MKSEWIKKKLSDIADFNPRETIKKGSIAKKISMDVLRPFCRDVPYYTEESFSGGTKFRNGDTIMARITPCLENGKTAQVSILNDGEVGFGSTEYIVFRAKEGIADKDYLFYLVCSPEVREPAIKSMVGSSGRQRVQTDVVKNLVIEVPPLAEQEKIGSFLKLIDDKIALNDRINKNLEQQAKAVFKSWFEDFDPFDEPLIETPAGIYAPASLQMVQIANIPHVLETGKRPKGGAVASGVPSIGAENVKQLGVVNFSSAKFIPEEFAEKMKTGAINGYELLLYKDGGKPGTFIPHFSMFGEDFPYQKFFINEHVFKLDFGDKGFNEFAYFFMQTDYAYHWLASNGGKAAVPGINQQNVKDIWIFSPENSKVKEFGEWVQPLFTTILKNCAQNVKLAELRDTLLPKLMSGELDVSDIEL